MAEEHCRTVEVKGICEQTSQDTLENYFSLAKRGGKISHIQYDRLEGRACITFEEPEGAQKALQSTPHRIDNVELNVNIKLAVNVESNKLYVEGFRKETSSDSLKYYVESISGQDVTDVILGPRCNAIVTVDGVLDFDRIHQLSQTKQLDGNILTIRRVPVPRTILVSDLPPSATRDALLYKFESPRSGGGEIENVRVNLQERTALVKFKDPTVLRNVLSRKQTLDGTQLMVRPYHVLIGGMVEKQPKTGHDHVVREPTVATGQLPYPSTTPGSNEPAVVRGPYPSTTPGSNEPTVVRGPYPSTTPGSNEPAVVRGPYPSTTPRSNEPAVVRGQPPRYAPTKHHVEIDRDLFAYLMKNHPQNLKMTLKDMQPTVDEGNDSIMIAAETNEAENDLKAFLQEYKCKVVEFDPALIDYGLDKKIDGVQQIFESSSTAVSFKSRCSEGFVKIIGRALNQHNMAVEEVKKCVNLAKEKRDKETMQCEELIELSPEILKLVDCVFAIVTAAINPSLLQKIEPSLYKSILDETEVTTGIQWHHSAYGLLVTGSFEQVKKANDVLKLQFSKACSQQSNAEHPQSWNEVYMESGDKSCEYHGGSPMVYPASMYGTDRQHPQHFANIPSNFPEGNSSHRNIEPSFNFMTETNLQDKQSWKRGNTREADRDGNQSSHHVFGKKHDDSGGSLFNARIMSGGTHANAQDMVKHPPQTGDKESNPSPFQPSPGTETGIRESNPNPFRSPRGGGTHANAQDMVKHPPQTGDKESNPSPFQPPPGTETAARESNPNPFQSPPGSEMGTRESNPSPFQSPPGTETAARESNPSPFQSPPGTETGARESNPSPFQSPRGSETAASESNSILFPFPRENTARNNSPARELKTPAHFQQSGKPSGAVFPTQTTQSGHASWSTSDQNDASVKTEALFEESSHETKKKISNRHPSQAERRPNAANFPPLSKDHSRRAEDSSLVTPNTASPSLEHECENPQCSFEEPSVATVEDKGTQDGSSVQQSSNNTHNSDESKSDSPIPKNEPCADSLDVIENAFQQMKLDEETSSIGAAKFIQQIYRDDLEMFKSRYGVDVVLSEDQKRFTLKPMQQGVTQSQLSEAEGKLQQFFKAMSGKLTAVTIDLRKFTAEDTEKIRESMSRQHGQFDVMIEESNRGVYSLVGSAENVEMFRRNVIGALQKNSPVTKEMAPTDPIVASRKGVRVILMLGDLEKQECDAIVNFTDRELVHKTGIACAIKQAAGIVFWVECRDIIAKNGSLVSNMVTITTGGTLPCQHVIHAILPDFSKERRQEALCHGLEETCRHALRIAKEKQLKSICFPVVTPDIVNLPCAVSSRLLFDVITKFIEENSPLDNNTIEEIRIVYRKNSKFAEDFANQFANQFSKSF